jgi:hypothetical protein
MTAPTFVNDSLARGLSKQTLEHLVVAAKMSSNAINNYILEAIKAQMAGKSPAKLANQLRASISALIEQPCINGRLVSASARNFTYTYLMPEIKDEHLVFSLAIGVINTRRKLVPNHVVPVVEITRHSVERLHQRLNTIDFDDVYCEIGAIAMMAPSMKLAAREIGARQWALPSGSGLFVAVPGGQEYLTTLVTWIPFDDNLSPKWSRLMADLQAVPELDDFSIRLRPELVEILSRHRWLQEPYESHPEPPFRPGHP